MLLLGLKYLVLSLPAVANPLADSLRPLQAQAPETLRQIDTLVILDGDNRRGRAREAGRVLAAGVPDEVWVLGSRWVVDELIRTGFPTSVVKRDWRTPNTRLQMARVAQLAAAQPGRQVAVIASRLQMPRVEALARAEGIQARFFASEIDDEPPTSGVRLIVPTYIALRVSRDAIYEHAALALYRRRGWIQ